MGTGTSAAAQRSASQCQGRPLSYHDVVAAAEFSSAAGFHALGGGTVEPFPKQSRTIIGSIHMIMPPKAHAACALPGQYNENVTGPILTLPLSPKPIAPTL